MKRTRLFRLPLLAFTVFALTALALTQPAQAQNRWGLPGSPTGQALAALFDVIDSGAEADIRAFVEDKMDADFRENHSMAEHIGFFRETHRLLVPFEVMMVNKTGPHTAEAVLAAKESDERARVVVGLDDEGRFNELDIRPDMGPQVRFESFDDLGKYLREEAEAGRFSGVVLVAREGEIVFLDGQGLADRAARRDNQFDTKFNLGSINKAFTGVAVLQLAEAGKIDLDASLGTYVEGFPEDVAQKVTIRHLLQHRSGWAAYWDHPYFLENRKRLRTVADYLVFLRDEPLDFEPGTNEQYSNTGYHLLGAVIESASGMDYYDYMRAHVYGPAGMTNTDSYFNDEPVANRAIGYLETPEGFTEPNTEMLPARGTPAGGGYSTAEDLLRFDQALRAHQLLSAPYTNLFFNRFDPAGMDEAPRGMSAIAGGAPGISAAMAQDLPDGPTAVVLTNYGEGSSEHILRPILDLLGDGPDGPGGPGGPGGRTMGAGPSPIAPPGMINIDGPAALPMTRMRGLPVIEATIDGKGPFRFMIDLGANVFAVSPAVAEAIGAESLGKDPMGNEIVPVRRLGLGAITLGALAAAVDPWFAQHDFDGVLGTNVFEELLLTLDFPAGVVRLDEGRLPEADGETVFAYTMRNGSPAIDVMLAGQSHPAVLDTGAQRSLILPDGMAEELDFAEGPVPDGQVAGPGMGVREALAGRLSGDLVVGRYTMPQPVATLHAMRRPEVLLGSGFLGQFALTFDQRSQRVRLARTGPARLADPSPMPGG